MHTSHNLQTKFTYIILVLHICTPKYLTLKNLISNMDIWLHRNDTTKIESENMLLAPQYYVQHVEKYVCVDFCNCKNTLYTVHVFLQLQKSTHVHVRIYASTEILLPTGRCWLLIVTITAGRRHDTPLSDPSELDTKWKCTLFSSFFIF